VDKKYPPLFFLYLSPPHTNNKRKEHTKMEISQEAKKACNLDKMECVFFSDEIKDVKYIKE